MFNDRGVVFALQRHSMNALTSSNASPAGSIAESPVIPPRETNISDILQFSYEGTAGATQIEGIDPLPTTVNYYVGTDSSQWRAGLTTYNGIAYRTLYPGIDLIYNQTETGLKSTFNISAGAQPEQIHWRYSGAPQLQLGAAGKTLVATIATDLSSSVIFTESAPLAWQIINGQRVDVAVTFNILPDGSIGFGIGSYDASIPLTIDPFLEYSTFFGGSLNEEVWDITVDAMGRAYIIGNTESSDLPATPGGADGTYNGSRDVFIARLNPSGTAYDYITYIGGNNDDRGFAIALDSANNAVVTGMTWSSDFPITAGVVETIPNSYSAIVVKVNTVGGMMFSTFLAGGGSTGHDIKLDSQNNIYVVGTTGSPTLGASSNAYQTTLQGGWDVFLAKLNSTATSNLYRTYIGGSGTDEGIALDLNGPNQIFIVGHTESSNFPMVNAYQSTRTNPTIKDAFVLRLDLNPTSMGFSTYLGGGGYDYGWDIDVGPNGSAYVAGTTDFNSILASTGAFDNVQSGGHGYIAKFSNSGSRMYIARLGNGDTTEAHRLAVDGEGKVHFTGTVLGNGLPLIGAWQYPYSGDYDGYLGVLNASGTALDYLTYFGGYGPDCEVVYTYNECSIALGPNNTQYVAGTMHSSNFPITPNAPDKTLGNNAFSDGFVLSISNNSYAISGQIINRYGSALPSGIFILSDLGGSTSITTNINSSGAYAFSAYVAGTYVVTPVLAGPAASLYYVSPTSRAATVPGSTAGLNFEVIPFNPLYSISGAIKRISGNPLSGVIVFASNGDYAITDAQGRYTIPISLTGTYVLTPTLPGYLANPTTQVVQITTSNASNIDFSMKAYYKLGGRVLSNDGSPISGATVSITQESTTFFVTTNNAGEYIFNNIPEGSYLLSVQRDGYTGQFDTPLPLVASTTLDLTLFRLQPIFNLVYIPLTLRDYIKFYDLHVESEPNNTSMQANGPIRSGIPVYGLPDDQKDYFFFYLMNTGDITVNLSNHTGKDVQLQLFYQTAGNRPVPVVTKPPYRITYSRAPSGLYFVYINTGSGYNSTQTYELTITY